MSETEKALTNQLQRINQTCLGLFDTLLLISERTIIQRSVLRDSDSNNISIEIEEYTAALVNNSLHYNVKARATISVKYARNILKLLVYGREADSVLLTSVKLVFSRDYGRLNVDILKDVKF